ncbi:MAG TPA: hypothetical protein VF407_01070, partial [Polyangiaceae bacterium]
MRRASLVLGTVALVACGWRAPLPDYRTHDAAFGFLADPAIGSSDPPSKDEMCGSWMTDVVGRDPLAVTH